MVIINFSSAGRSTTNEELEEMLESGNPAIFTQGVSIFFFWLIFSLPFFISSNFLFKKKQKNKKDHDRYTTSETNIGRY